MARYMPTLENWFHYRNLDVSTLKELCRRWKPDVAEGFSKESAHTALADIRESIEELRYYRDAIFVPRPGPAASDLVAIAARHSGALSPEKESELDAAVADSEG